MKPQAFFSKYPVFTRGEIATHLAPHGERSSRTIDSLLAYHLRAGRIFRIRRGLYSVLTTGREQAVDPYLIASRLAPDAVLAYHTALELFGRSYSIQHRSLILSGHRVRPLAFRGHRYKVLRPPKAIRDRKKESFGVEIVDRQGLDVRVTGLERTLVDVLDRPDLGGGWEEVWRSLETIEFFDLDTVVEYVRLLDNATTAAKVGFFLEQNREPLMVEERVLDRLRRLRPREPHYVERGAPQPTRLLSGWNLVVPESLVRRSWEELA